jgi:hypothetical protein
MATSEGVANVVSVPMIMSDFAGEVMTTSEPALVGLLIANYLWTLAM